ncbi:MAG: hypothetical protein HYU02_03165 [Thaumarchaeota archaeon]|nr:hypothetical protein [Nitrososphaerota archaeon]
MTDTLTVKEIIEKTYTYVDRLVKECRKDVMGVVAKERSANANEVGKAVANAVLDWFGRRDRHIRIMFDPRTVIDTPEPGIRMVFTGESKDASFKIHSHVTYYMSGNVCYAKNMSLEVDKRDFSKRA